MTRPPRAIAVKVQRLKGTLATTLQLGDPDLLWTIRQPGETPVRIALEAGANVTRLTFAGGGFRRDYLIDLEHGAIVRRRSDLSEQGDLLFQLNQDDVRQVGERGWFPYRMTVLMPGPSGCSVKELVIEDADFNSAPAADVFRLEFPAPIPMIHQGKMVRYDPQKVWDLAHLPSLSSGRANRFVVNQPSPPEPRMSGPRRQRWPFVVPAALIGLVLLVVAASLYWRSRARG